MYSDVSGPVFYDNLSLKPATVVVNTADNSDFSAGKTNLYYAITNCESGGTIAFNIPGPGPHTIQPRSALPRITDALIIDGYTQPGALPASHDEPAVIKIDVEGMEGKQSGSESAWPEGAGSAGKQQ